VANEVVKRLNLEKSPEFNPETGLSERSMGFFSFSP
jgi:hypothetical protein